LNTSDFDYDLPPERIAQTPIEPRDASRLMVLDRATGAIEHRRFREIGDYLQPGDVLVFNDTRVIPARLYGRKIPSGGKVELLLLARREAQVWEALVGGAGVRAGSRLEVSGAEGLSADVVEELDGPRRLLRFSQPLTPLLPSVGRTPLPPYIHETLDDPERYQTVYAKVPGSAAAPTAGLHFTPDLLLRLRGQGVEFVYVTLHVGLDTFAPVTEMKAEEHRIHSEWCAFTPDTARQVNQAKLAGRRVVAVGTTSVRVLESAARASLRQAQAEPRTSPLKPGTPRPIAPRAIDRTRGAGESAGEAGAEGQACPWRPVIAFEGPTDLFILPGFSFRAVDALVTNFHLPRSTLVMLVSAFAGRETVLRAYATAIEEGYRFYSFGDAMLVL
jgi:S-adenosylmethionine:tRNA ribosyltransferase-isomerase